MCLFHCEEAGKGFSQVADGLSFLFVLTKTWAWGHLRFWNVEGIGKRLGFATERERMAIEEKKRLLKSCSKHMERAV